MAQTIYDAANLVERRGAALEKQKQTKIIRRFFSDTKPRLSRFRMSPTKRGLSRSSMFRFWREFALNEGKGLLLESTLPGRQRGLIPRRYSGSQLMCGDYGQKTRFISLTA
jgi:hypothetical protein